tara:strand:- start:548 stop:730 length:183 start_codon:yes stop_codon:yes gene_type:complete
MLIVACQARVGLTDQQLDWDERDQKLKSIVDRFGSEVETISSVRQTSYQDMTPLGRLVVG